MNAHDAVKVLTAQEVALRYSIHCNTVYRAIRSKQLKAIKVAGQWKVDPDDADHWAANGGPTR